MKKKESFFDRMGCAIIILINACTLGAYSFDYCLWVIFGKNIPYYTDCIAGFLFPIFTVPLMVLCWIIQLCGVSTPFIGG